MNLACITLLAHTCIACQSSTQPVAERNRSLRVYMSLPFESVSRVLWDKSSASYGSLYRDSQRATNGLGGGVTYDVYHSKIGSRPIVNYLFGDQVNSDVRLLTTNGLQGWYDNSSLQASGIGVAARYYFMDDSTTVENQPKGVYGSLGVGVYSVTARHEFRGESTRSSYRSLAPKLSLGFDFIHNVDMSVSWIVLGSTRIQGFQGDNPVLINIGVKL
jgi:hypothetical protein